MLTTTNKSVEKMVHLKKAGRLTRLFNEEQIDFELIGFVVSNFVVLRNIKTGGLFLFSCTDS